MLWFAAISYRHFFLVFCTASCIHAFRKHCFFKNKGKAWNRNSLDQCVCWTNTERQQGGKSLLHAEGKHGITYEWLHACLPDSMNESPRIRLCSSNEHRNSSDFHLQSLIINIVYGTRQGRKHSQTWLMCFISRAAYVGLLRRSPLWDHLWAYRPFGSSNANISSQAWIHWPDGLHHIHIH